ncbi:MAG: Bug family tripartite tricarboxylate transporter substrate binding protein [Beijerinckiaceae bacterium]
MNIRCILPLAASLILAVAGGANAQDEAGFFKGKSVRILVGTASGGDYDTQARLLSRHIGRHIPGQPAVIVENMTGAGGLNMTNYLYRLAPKDGSYLGVIPNNFPAQQWAGGAGIQFDVARFNWIGGLTKETSTMVAWAASGVKTLDDVKTREVVAGATSRGAITYSFPAMLNTLVGARFKIITGYTGGSEVNVAMERGEVVARMNSWASWKATKPDWIKNNLINVLVQAGPRHPELAHVPSLEDMAKNDDDRKIMEIALVGNRLGRPLAAPPDTPPERVETLRAAFRQMVDDSAFRAEAGRLTMDLDPTWGADMQAQIDSVMRIPKDLLPRAKAFLE